MDVEQIEQGTTAHTELLDITSGQILRCEGLLLPHGGTAGGRQPAGPGAGQFFAQDQPCFLKVGFQRLQIGGGHAHGATGGAAIEQGQVQLQLRDELAFGDARRGGFGMREVDRGRILGLGITDAGGCGFALRQKSGNHRVLISQLRLGLIQRGIRHGGRKVQAAGLTRCWGHQHAGQTLCSHRPLGFIFEQDQSGIVMTDLRLVQIDAAARIDLGDGLEVLQDFVVGIQILLGQAHHLPGVRPLQIGFAAEQGHVVAGDEFLFLTGFGQRLGAFDIGLDASA